MKATDEQQRMENALQPAMTVTQPRAVAARYDRKSRRILILLTNGLELSLPVRLAHGLASEPAADLEEIEISPAGLALHWPKLDADLYLPSLLRDMFGTRERRWRAYWDGWGDR